MHRVAGRSITVLSFRELFVSLQGCQCLFNQLAPELFFFGGRNRGIANDMHDAVTQHQAIGSNHLCNRQSRGDLHCRNTGFFQFSRDRSAAACAGASRGRENDRLNTQAFGFLGHFAPHPASIR